MAETADLVLTNCLVLALDEGNTTARAVAVSEGRITAVGGEDEVRALSSPEALVEDLRGAVVLPGLIDSHLHVAQLGKVSEQAFLYDVRSIEEMVDRMKEHASKVEGPVIGRGGNFHETSLEEGRLPTAADLDRVSSDRPVMITDVNKTIVNSLVLSEMDISDVPEGGEAPLDAQGRPPGIFLYSAKKMTPLGGQSETPGSLSPEEAVLRGLDYCRRMGLTSVVNPSARAGDIERFRSLNSDGRLPIRVTAMPFLMSPAELESLGSPGQAGGRLTLGPVKVFFDAFVMHRTALMYEPYEGQDNFGGVMNSAETVRKSVEEALSRGWPVGVHTTGDKGMDIAVSIIEEGLGRHGPAAFRSHMIHCYFPTEKAMETAVERDIAVAAQPTFIRTWGETVRGFVGEKRGRRLVPLRSMLSHGLVVGGGADGPITWPDPWAGIYAAVTRRTEGGKVLGPEERISVLDALRMYTTGSAAVTGQEGNAGSIEVGKRADLTIIDRNVLEIGPEDIPNVRVLRTIVGGETVHEAD